MFKHYLGVVIYKLIRNMLHVNFKLYYTEINKIHKLLTRFLQYLILFISLNFWLILVVGFGQILIVLKDQRYLHVF